LSRTGSDGKWPLEAALPGAGPDLRPLRSMGRLLGDFRIQARISQSRYGPGLDSTFCAIPFFDFAFSFSFSFSFRDPARIVHG
jgi:hypothetical protein